MSVPPVAVPPAAVPPAALPPVAIVIPTWNRKDDVLRCLDSVQEIDYPQLAVVVVDNGSADGTAAAVRSRFPACTVLRHAANLGFAGGNNAGIRWALARGAAYVLLLNNDALATPDLVTSLVRAAAADARIAAVGARNLRLHEPAHLWGAYGELTYGPFVVRTAGHGAADGPDWQRPRDVDWVVGNGMLLSRAALEAVGLLDEHFFAYHEDVDWCVRARRAGFRVVYAGTAAVLHEGGGSSDPRRAVAFPRPYFLGRNGVLFVRKHATRRERLRFAGWCGGAFAGRVARALLLRAAPSRGARARGRAYWAMEVGFVRGLLAGMRGTPVPFAALGLADCAMPDSVPQAAALAPAAGLS